MLPSTIAFSLEYVFVYQFYAEQKELHFSMTYICACEVNGSILGPGLIRHRSVQPFFQSVSHV